MINLAFVGGAGRMGQALAAGFFDLPDFHVAALVDPTTPTQLFGGSAYETIAEIDPAIVDVVIDFSHPVSVVT